jgi:pimeloyl-ACP methyl ester carboxylesterase
VDGAVVTRTHRTHRSYVDLELGQIHVRQSGTGDAGVLLLHQAPSSSAMWEPLLPELAALGRRTVALDLPGHGLSDPLPGPAEPEMADYARTVGAVAAALGLSRVCVVGHHTGATVALQLAVDLPDVVSALVLWGIPLLDETRLTALATERLADWDPEGDEIGALWRRRLARSAAPDPVAVTARAVLESLQCGAHRSDGHRAVGRTDHGALLRSVTQPVLGLAGDREDLQMQTELACSLVDTGTYRRFGDHGIDVADEAPAELARTIVEFAERCRC